MFTNFWKILFVHDFTGANLMDTVLTGILKVRWKKILLTFIMIVMTLLYWSYVLQCCSSIAAGHVRGYKKLFPKWKRIVVSRQFILQNFFLDFKVIIISLLRHVPLLIVILFIHLFSIIGVFKYDAPFSTIIYQIVEQRGLIKVHLFRDLSILKGCWPMFGWLNFLWWFWKNSRLKLW